MTKCEELQFDLPLYTDGSLDVDVRSAIDAHLPECPLCRQKLSEFRDLRLGLKSVPRLTAPDRLVESIRTTIAAQLAPAGRSPVFYLIERQHRWTEVWLMPFSVSTMATLVLGFTLLSLVLNSGPIPFNAYSPASNSSSTPVFLATNSDLSPDEYAYARLAISGESPSINPRGALVALTKSFVRGEMRDDEVVVVADVFGNGLAQIAEVVEPSHDRRAIEELQRALGSDPSFAPFVPANMDQRSENVRVILKIQNVNVRTGSDAP
ncbi:MAG TPA: zf-HC2 domain-containing protein [Pyrinomonadaceae bacterium]